jgi:predicted nucleic acid-binding protein
VTRYLLDTNILTAYLRGRAAIVVLVEPWIRADEAVTSIIVYGEIVEYLQRLTGDDYARDLNLLHGLLQRQVPPLPLSFAIMERYATLRRALRLPYGPGLIGDMDTLIAATALEHGLEVVTADSDYTRAPGLVVRLIPRTDLT